VEQIPLAEIFVPQQGSGCKKGQIATGYAITQNLVLTARHPLFPEQGDPSQPKRAEDFPIEIRWRHPEVDDPAKCWTVRDIRWQGGKAYDVALLECDIPFKVREPVYLSDKRPQPPMRWESQGFPRVGGMKNTEKGQSDSSVARCRPSRPGPERSKSSRSPSRRRACHRLGLRNGAGMISAFGSLSLSRSGMVRKSPSAGSARCSIQIKSER